MDSGSETCKRFATISSQEIGELLENKDSKNTKKRVNQSSTIFKQFLIENGLSAEMKDHSLDRLDQHLAKFFACVRTKNGEHFKTNSMQSLRYGVSKFIKAQTGVDITEHESFRKSCEVYNAVLVDLKKKGLGTTEHTPAISPEDMARLYDSNHLVFNTTVPFGLQRKVWFELMYFLCRRGRENLREMTRDTFMVETDSTGRRYVCQKRGELDKNHREKDRPDDTTGEGRMYALRGNDLCPVASYEKYISKLNPDNAALWQRPNDSFVEDEPWYTRAPLGKNSIGTMMNVISKTACLSRIYTNHSIRATAITALDDAGVEARHIMRTTGHKSESSIRSYSNRVCEEKKRDISDKLSAARNATTTSVSSKRPLQETCIDNVSASVRPKRPCVSASPTRENNNISTIPDGENLDTDLDDLLSLTDSQMAGIVDQVRRSPVPTFSPQLQNMHFNQSTSDQRLLNFCPNIWNCNVTMNIYGGTPDKK